MLSADLYDPWRCKHASERDYTFYSSVHHTYSRIDLTLIDKHLLAQVKSSTIGTITWSDHAPILLTVQLSSCLPAPFSWKLNTYILSNPKHQAFLLSKLKEFFSYNCSPSTNAFTLWNSHKAYMRGVLIQLSSRLKRERCQKMNELLQNIKTLETKQQLSPSQENHKTLLISRLDLRQHLMGDYEFQLNEPNLSIIIL